jgi:hypothetical protein
MFVARKTMWGNRAVFVMVKKRKLPFNELGMEGGEQSRGASLPGTRKHYEACYCPKSQRNTRLLISKSSYTRRLHLHTSFNTMNGSNGTNGTSSHAKLLWKHHAPQSTPMYQFLQLVNKTHDLQLSNYPELHQWSIDNINDFWLRAWEFVGVRHERSPSSVSVLAAPYTMTAYQE